MADVVSGVTGGARIVLVWVFPTAIALAILQVLFLRPLGLEQQLGLDTLSAAEWALVVGAAATAIGLVLSALSTPLYRVLEGYSWPRQLREPARNRQRARRSRLAELSEKPLEGVEQDLVVESLMRFPRDESQIAPTGLGNALRAFERYGVETFRLDSQAFWTELVAVVPASLRVEIANARATVDFLVAVTYLSGAVGVLTIIAGFIAPGGVQPLLVVAGVGFVLLIFVWYRSALSATTYWDSTVRALVDLGRKPLAEALGFILPATLEKEREMWTLLAALGVYGYDASWSDQLDQFRAKPIETTEASKAQAARRHRSRAASAKESPDVTR